MTNSIRKNLLTAIELVESEPEHLINLAHYKQLKGGATLHCTLGVLCASGKWPEMKFRPQPGGGYQVVFGIDGCEIIHQRNEELASLFGENAYIYLFAARWDDELSSLSDKELALKRLRDQLTLYPEEVAA